MQPSPLYRLARWMRGKMHKYGPMMISCQELEDFIGAYMEGDLPEKQRFIFELHIKICRECREYLAAYKRSMEITKQAAGREVLGEVPEDLIKAILAAREE